MLLADVNEGEPGTDLREAVCAADSFEELRAALAAAGAERGAAAGAERGQARLTQSCRGTRCMCGLASPRTASRRADVPGHVSRASRSRDLIDGLRICYE